MDTLQAFDARALALNLTLTKLAKAAGVSSTTLAKMLRGEGVRPRVISKLDAKLRELERAAC